MDNPEKKEPDPNPMRCQRCGQDMDATSNLYEHWLQCVQRVPLIPKVSKDTVFSNAGMDVRTWNTIQFSIRCEEIRSIALAVAKRENEIFGHLDQIMNIHAQVDFYRAEYMFDNELSRRKTEKENWALNGHF